MRVNLGSGSIQPDGWTNVDRDDHGQLWVADVTDGLPFLDGTAYGIVANHSLQQVRWEDLPAVFAELHRVLTPGGTLRVVVPDVVAGVLAAERRDWDWFPNTETDPTVRLTAWLTWYGTNLTCFTADALRWAFRAGGFAVPTLVGPGYTAVGPRWICDLDDRAGESIFMEAAK